MKQNRCRQRGFTLIEIMIVVLIIGILLSIALPSFVRTRETSQTKGCIETLYKIQLAKEQWAMDNNKPSTDTPAETDLWPDDGSSYMRTAPRCPGGGTYQINSINSMPTCSVGVGGGAHKID